MGMIRLAFTLRFIVYTLSILLTAALLPAGCGVSARIDLAAVLWWCLLVYGSGTATDPDAARGAAKIIRSQPICVSCSNRYDPRCVKRRKRPYQLRAVLRLRSIKYRIGRCCPTRGGYEHEEVDNRQLDALCGGWGRACSRVRKEAD
jgi:hypothetical protein